jgi:hypothetical protein
MQQKNRMQTYEVLQRMLEIDGRIYRSKSDDSITLRDRRGRHVQFSVHGFQNSVDIPIGEFDDYLKSNLITHVGNDFEFLIYNFTGCGRAQIAHSAA